MTKFLVVGYFSRTKKGFFSKEKFAGVVNSVVEVDHPFLTAEDIDNITKEIIEKEGFDRLAIVNYKRLGEESPVKEDLIERKPIIDFIVSRLNSKDKEKAFGFNAIEILSEIQFADEYKGVRKDYEF